MRNPSTMILRIAIAVIGAIVLALCLFALPAMWQAVPKEYPDHTYVFYSILTAMYVAAVPFYGALYQAMRLLRYIDADKAFSLAAVTALKNISVCAGLISLIFVFTAPFFYTWAQGDDAPGLVVINLFLILAPAIIAVFSAVLQRLFKQAVDIKSENELTV